MRMLSLKLSNFRCHLSKTALGSISNVTRCRCHQYLSISALQSIAKFHLPPASERQVRAEVSYVPSIRTIYASRVVFSSSDASTSSTVDATAAAERFLCRDTFPLGNLSSQAGREMVRTMIEQQLAADRISPETVQTMFALMDRLYQELEFLSTPSERRTTGVAPTTSSSGVNITSSIVNVLSIEQHQQTTKLEKKDVPNDMIHRIVKAWKLHCKDETSGLTPREVFETVKRWGSQLCVGQDPYLPYKVIIDVAGELQDPVLADNILDFLIESSTTTSRTYLSTSVFNSVIDAWANTVPTIEAAERAETILKKMTALATDGLSMLQPDVNSYNSVAQAWANVQDNEEACHRLDEHLRDMIRHGLITDKTAVCTVVLTSLSKNKGRESEDWVRSILADMLQLEDKPDASAYRAVMNAHIHRGDALGAEHVLQTQIQQFESTGDRNDLPDAASFNAVMIALAKSGRPDAPELTEALLNQLFDLSESLRIPAMRPNVDTFNSVLCAWAQSKAPKAAPRSEAILVRMRELYTEKQFDTQPDATSCEFVLGCWSKSSVKEAGRRAESVLRHFIHLNKSGMACAEPSIFSYNAVIAAWYKSSTPESLERCQALFDEVKAGAGRSNLKPDRITYGTMISCWGQSGRKDGAAKAQAIFDEMMNRYEGGEADLKPTVIHYGALIDAWSKAKNAQNAEKILRKMQDSLAGGDGVKPNAICYNAVLSAWCHSNHPDSSQRAQTIFDEMIRRWESGDRDLRPTPRTFAILITAWGRKAKSSDAMKAQAAFDDMWSRYKQGAFDLKPDVVVFNNLMHAWAKAREPERAEALLRDMQTQRFDNIRPSAISYNIVMNALSRSGLPDAAERTQALYDELMLRNRHGERDMKPDTFTYTAAIEAWCRSKRSHGRERAKGVFADMQTAYQSGDRELKPTLDRCDAILNGWIKV